MPAPLYLAPVSAGALVLLTRLWGYAGQDRHWACPRAETLQSDLGLSRSTCYRHLRELRRAGLIEPEARALRGRDGNARAVDGWALHIPPDLHRKPTPPEPEMDSIANTARPSADLSVVPVLGKVPDLGPISSPSFGKSPKSGTDPVPDLALNSPRSGIRILLGTNQGTKVPPVPPQGGNDDDGQVPASIRDALRVLRKVCESEGASPVLSRSNESLDGIGAAVDAVGWPEVVEVTRHAARCSLLPGGHPERIPEAWLRRMFLGDGFGARREALQAHREREQGRRDAEAEAADDEARREAEAQQAEEQRGAIGAQSAAALDALRRGEDMASVLGVLDETDGRAS